MYVDNYVENTYVENTVLGDDPLELVRLLYVKAIDKLNHAEKSLAEGDIPGRAGAIAHAAEIIVELQSALDLEQGGDIARNLARLYEYIQRRLAEANAQQRLEPLEEARRLLETIYDGWRELRAAGLEAAPQSEPGETAPPVGAAPASPRNWTL